MYLRFMSFSSFIVVGFWSGVITDQSNHIIDVSRLDLSNPKDMEIQINSIPGVVENGIFAIRKPNKVLTA